MASEERARRESGRYEQIGSSSVVSLAASGTDASRMLEELRLENAGLRRLVAELLVANQQLRERYGLGRRESEVAGPLASARAKSQVEAKGPFG
jgi:hypothetical protein